MNLRETIDQSPMSSYQWLIVVMAAIMNLLDGFDVLALAFTATPIRTEFGLSGVELGYLFSAGLIGMTGGSLFLAPLADKIGRRSLLLIAVSLSAIGMLGSAFVASSFVLGFWRAITGIGVGAILVGTNVITSEYSSRKWRSVAISIYAAGFGLGAVLGGMFANVLQPEYGWRAVFLAGAILTGLFLIVLWIWLPESIDFLTDKQPPNAKIRLNRIMAKIGLKGEWELPPKSEQKIAHFPFTQLFGVQYLRSTILIWLAFFAIMFSFYLVNSWTPALLKDAGMTIEQGNGVGMMISLGGTIGFGIMVGALMNGCISGLYTLNPSIYATDIRSTGVGWSIGIGRLGAILAPTIAGQLLDNGWNKQSLYTAVAFIMLISTVSLFLLHNKSAVKKI